MQLDSKHELIDCPICGDSHSWAVGLGSHIAQKHNTFYQFIIGSPYWSSSIFCDRAGSQTKLNERYAEWLIAVVTGLKT